MATTRTKKGQLTIPKHVRDTLGLKAFDQIEVEVAEGGTARLRKVTRPTLREVAGSLPTLDIPVEDMPRIAKDERAARKAKRRT